MIRALTVASILSLTVPAFAAEEAKPGEGPTAAVGEAVPTMKGDCADKANVDTKAPGTEATEATGKAVPTMTAKAEDCLKDAESEKMDTEAKKTDGEEKK